MVVYRFFLEGSSLECRMFFDVFVHGSDVAGRVVVSSLVASKADSSCGGRIRRSFDSKLCLLCGKSCCLSKNEEFFCCGNAPTSKLLFTMVVPSSMTVLTFGCSVVLGLVGDQGFLCMASAFLISSIFPHAFFVITVTRLKF